MRLIDGDDVDRLCTPELGLAAARQAAAVVAARDLTTGRVQVADDTTWMRVLCGIVPRLDLVGYKEFHRVGQRVRYHVSLFRRSTADCLGIVDGRRITSLRTASTAALAFAKVFAGREIPLLGVVGSGEEAREGLRAVAAAVPVGRARVFSPTTANREAFARELGVELGLEVEPVATADAALDGATAAYVATSAAGAPSISRAQVAHVRLLAGIGSTRPDQRELVGDVLSGADEVVVDCDDARHEPGDVVEAVADHGFDAAGAVLLGDWLERPLTPAATTVFKSIGSVEQDLVLAHALLAAAADAGAGRIVDDVGSLRIMR